ncbi:hypothetical protein [Chelonobacter oris]|nr:hypothetical protein [Chelonobacter oris]
MLVSLIDLIKEVSGNNPLIIVPIVILLFILINMKSILLFLQDLKRSRIGKIKEAIDSDCLTENTRRFIKEELENEYFNLIAGIYIERKFREALLSFYKEYSGEITFRTIQRAFRYINFSNSKLHVKITKCDKIEYYLHWLLFIFFFLFAMGILVASVVIEGKNIMIKFFIFGSLGLIFIFLSVWSLAQANKIKTAEKIAQLLENTTSERN